MSNGKKFAFALIAFLLVFAVLEGAFYITGKALESRWGMWRTPGEADNPIENLTYAQYLEYRDPFLGWPYPREFGEYLDLSGAHHNPYYPDGPRGGSCISLYGDSFTQGGDFSELQLAWSNVLSKTLGCNVSNWGIAGYGTDQAFLRFRENESDTAPTVVFGVHTGDAIRNLTRLRDLENYQMWFALKPRFIIDAEGGLELVEIPTLSEDEYRRVIGLEDDLLLLEHESLQPGGPAGAVQLRFPYSVSVIRNMLGFYGFRARLRREPVHAEFLQAGHPLMGMEIMVGLGEKLVELAKQRGKRPLIVIMPLQADFDYRKKHGRWPHQDVVDGYARANLPVVDLGPYLNAEIERTGTSLSSFFGPTGHYGDQGNELVARLVVETLRPN